MDEIAEEYAEQSGLTVEDVFKRWDGHPERIAEDLFETYNFETGEIAQLELFYPYQPKLMHAYFYGDGKIISVYKGRRIGVSFIFVLCMLIDGIQNEGAFFPIVSTRMSSSESRINDIRKLIENAKVEIPVKKDNKGEIVLWNDTSFRAYTGNPDSARGDDSARTVMVDEMAFLENQEDTMRAFMPFVSLGKDSTMLQVTTPKVSNDLFMETHRRGTESGYTPEGERTGVVSVQQPSFKYPDEIDIETSLYEQDVQAVRPDMDIDAVEAERAQDPQGFAQEYLCRPISDEYRFFSIESIKTAMQRGTRQTFGPSAKPQHGGQMVAGVDFGMNDDQTVVSVFEHVGKKRFLRYLEVLDNHTLSNAGFNPPDRANPNHIAGRLKQLKSQLEIDFFVMDATSFGKTFKSVMNQTIGRGVLPFDFNDRKGVKQMMGDLNYGLRNELVTLVEDDRMFDQLSSVVKEQKEDYQTPKFSGKDYSQDGKDDIAMSLMLGAYPKMLDTGRSTHLHEKEKRDDRMAESGTKRPVQRGPGPGSEEQALQSPSFGSRGLSRSRSRRTYKSRHSRR